MSKVVESSYRTVDDTVSAIERLLDEGRTLDDIVIVTSQNNYSNIQNRTIVEIDKVSASGDKSMWEKFKELFTDVKQDVALEHYGIDKQTALRYEDVLKAGNYVVLVEEDNSIPIRQNLEDGPKELGKSSKEQRNKKPIGQSGSGTKIISNTSEPSGKPALFYDKEIGLLHQEIDYLSDKYSGKKEDESNMNAGFKKARQEKPVGQAGSGVRTTKDTTLLENERAMESLEDKQLYDSTVKEDKKRFSGEMKNKRVKNAPDPMDNPLQGKPKDKTRNQHETDYETEDMNDTPVEDSVDLPRFSGNSITGQPVVDPLKDRE